MPTLDNLATRFAHSVSLFRDPTAKAEQKKEFRALLGLLQDTAVTLRVDAGGSGIELNGVPCEGEGLAGLVRRPGQWPPTRTSGDGIPSYPARTRRSIVSPASTARRAFCGASRGATSSPCRSKAFPWSRTTRHRRRPRTR